VVNPFPLEREVILYIVMTGALHRKKRMKDVNFCKLGFLESGKYTKHSWAILRNDGGDKKIKYTQLSRQKSAKCLDVDGKLSSGVLKGVIVFIIKTLALSLG
jgi:hypothetical protein